MQNDALHLDISSHTSNHASHTMNGLMRISFMTGVFLLFMKLYAYIITGSSAILSDCSESIIHVFAVGFATFSMWLSFKPADRNHQYGHDKISFFSAGFEGAMIAIAAIYILYESISRLIYGIELAHLSEGITFVFIAMLINGSLGTWLIMKGKRYQSLILKANGRHLLTDCVTSLAVVVGLIGVQLTGVLWIDPVVAILAACHILFSGGRLVYESVGGLMDKSDETFDRQAVDFLDSECRKRNIQYRNLRHRKAGRVIFIEFHLLFPSEISLSDAHEEATAIESGMRDAFSSSLDITTHLEPIGAAER